MAIDSYARTLAAAAISNSGSSDYSQLENKPKINNVTLDGNKSLSDLDVYSKEEIDNKITGLYRFKGSVETKADLDDIDKQTLMVGDVYNVIESGINYAWTGTEWDNLGSEIDVSIFANKVIVTPESDIELNGHLVPNLSTEDVLKAYNGMVEGNNVIISTSDDSNHFLASQVVGTDGSVQVKIIYGEVMVVTYTLENQEVSISYKGFGSELIYKTYTFGIDLRNNTSGDFMYLNDSYLQNKMAQIMQDAYDNKVIPMLILRYYVRSVLLIPENIEASKKYSQVSFRGFYVWSDNDANFASATTPVCLGNCYVFARLKWTGDTVSLDGNYSLAYRNIFFKLLHQQNTVAYTPTGDYNPATKKYVDDKVSEVEMFKFPNATIVGEPTITHGQVSDFTMNDYLEFPFLVDFRGRAFEINFAFTTGTNVDVQQNILDSEYGLAFAIRDKHLVLALSFNGTSWATEQVGTLTLAPQTTYRIRISWSRLLYKVQYSTDGGETYVDDISFGQNLNPYPKQMFIGVGKLADNYFEGSINLNYADVKINGELIWQGMDDVGLATRAATDLSNLDSAGVQKIKDIVAEDFATMAYVDNLIGDIETVLASLTTPPEELQAIQDLKTLATLPEESE